MELTYKISKTRGGKDTVRVEHDGTDLLVDASKEKLVELTRMVRENVLEETGKGSSDCDIPTEPDHTGAALTVSSKKTE